MAKASAPVSPRSTGKADSSALRASE